MHSWACFAVSVACERLAGECLRAKSTNKPYRVDCSIKRCVCGLFQRSRHFPMDKIGIYPIGPDFFPIRPIGVRLPNTGDHTPEHYIIGSINWHEPPHPDHAFRSGYLPPFRSLRVYLSHKSKPARPSRKPSGHSRRPAKLFQSYSLS